MESLGIIPSHPTQKLLNNFSKNKKFQFMNLRKIKFSKYYFDFFPSFVSLSLILGIKTIQSKKYCP